MTSPLYSASVPVFLHYLDRMDGMVRQTAGREHFLQARIAPDMFTAAQQVATATGFALRVAFPLAGREVPKLADHGMDRIGLGRLMVEARQGLQGLDPTEFAEAHTRLIRHRAGFAELDQTGADFLHLFGMPNFLFHASMAFAVLRQQGLPIGKADFDGLHDYPPGFRF
ncbi:DUF1993 family protein [Fuscibacter oryzae]|uniref:DUF1993 domain-containing protein n=1 Tax=Fuscibacter oryzae TaxID=2803939 RepID=A0A8J7MVH8_9RHOB|nr:DUF1993 family protein [Fuscibacter oryzae]MBL4928544.1 DUF1993 domain-containing protein [Fuscibacter oryzae]